MLENEIRRRWNAPPTFEYAKEAPYMLVYEGDRLAGGVEMGITPETFERIRQGRMCPKCFEPFETPHPKECPLCRLGERDRAKLLDRMHLGDAVRGRDYGPSTDLDAEVDRLDAELEEDNWRERPSTGIVVPSTVR